MKILLFTGADLGKGGGGWVGVLYYFEISIFGDGP